MEEGERHRRRTLRGGARGGVLDPVTVEPSTPASSGASGLATGATS
jgi:hypothetical protein